MCPQNENEISFHKEDSVLVLHLQQRALRKYSVPRKKINPGSKSTQRTCSLHTRGKRGTQYLKAISTATEKNPIFWSSYWLNKMSAFLILLTFL